MKGVAGRYDALALFSGFFRCLFASVSLFRDTPLTPPRGSAMSPAYRGG